jgi:hypothetical protein
MTWRPKADNEFKLLLQREVDQLPTELRQKLESIAVPVYKLSLPNRDSSSEKNIFVFGKFKDRILFYDDVEDEFGTAHAGLGQATLDYSLYGLLEHALQGLFAERSGSMGSG